MQLCPFIDVCYMESSSTLTYFVNKLSKLFERNLRLISYINKIWSRRNKNINVPRTKKFNETKRTVGTKTERNAHSYYTTADVFKEVARDLAIKTLNIKN